MAWFNAAHGAPEGGDRPRARRGPGNPSCHPPAPWEARRRPGAVARERPPGTGRLRRVHEGTPRRRGRASPGSPQGAEGDVWVNIAATLPESRGYFLPAGSFVAVCPARPGEGVRSALQASGPPPRRWAAGPRRCPVGTRSRRGPPVPERPAPGGRPRPRGGTSVGDTEPPEEPLRPSGRPEGQGDGRPRPTVDVPRAPPPPALTMTPMRGAARPGPRYGGRTRRADPPWDRPVGGTRPPNAPPRGHREKVRQSRDAGGGAPHAQASRTLAPPVKGAIRTPRPAGGPEGPPAGGASSEGGPGGTPRPRRPAGRRPRSCPARGPLRWEGGTRGPDGPGADALPASEAGHGTPASPLQDPAGRAAGPPGRSPLRRALGPEGPRRRRERPRGKRFPCRGRPLGSPHGSPTPPLPSLPSPRARRHARDRPLRPDGAAGPKARGRTWTARPPAPAGVGGNGDGRPNLRPPERGRGPHAAVAVPARPGRGNAASRCPRAPRRGRGYARGRGPHGLVSQVTSWARRLVAVRAGAQRTPAHRPGATRAIGAGWWPSPRIRMGSRHPPWTPGRRLRPPAGGGPRGAPRPRGRAKPPRPPGQGVTADGATPPPPRSPPRPPRPESRGRGPTRGPRGKGWGGRGDAAERGSRGEPAVAPGGGTLLPPQPPGRLDRGR